MFDCQLFSFDCGLFAFGRWLMTVFFLSCSANSLPDGWNHRQEDLRFLDVAGVRLHLRAALHQELDQEGDVRCR